MAVHTISLPAPIWTTGSTTSVKTGTWRAALPRHIHAAAPCHVACPVHGDIAVWIGQARAGDVHGAWQTLSQHNPLPASVGRVCHHPCESACNRAGHDEAVSICRLERHVGDTALERGWSYAAADVTRSERIAVVGGGPSGLSAAFQLRRRGYAVTLFEAQPELGGLMRYGIPAYRLTRKVLDGEIARILALGIEVRCGQALATPEALADLRVAFDAVYLAYGARRQKRLPQLDYGRPWVIDGAAYLAQVNMGTAPDLGRRLVVIGGGSAALDVARSARRARHEVTVLALEARADMPAQREEIVEADEEGITLLDAAMLRSVSADKSGAGLRLDCVRVHFERGTCGEPFAVTPRVGSGFILDADAIVSTIGQDPDLAPVAGICDSAGPLLKTDAAGATTTAGVWAGGDLSSAARFVSAAIAMGERAALAIERQLRPGVVADSNSAATISATVGAPIVALASINLHYHTGRARITEQRVAVPQRLAHGGEVQLGLDGTSAVSEATRCFSCGHCTHCDNCVTYCPDFAVRRTGDGYRVLSDYCKGCGLCVRECPSGAMAMHEELR